MKDAMGIWARAWDVCLRNRGAVLLYVGLMMIIGLAQDYLSSGGGFAVAQAIVAAALAIPAHLSVLKNIDGGASLKLVGDSKVMWPFVLRGFGLGVMAFAFPLIAMIAMLTTTDGSLGMAFLVFGALAAILSAIVFAKWGTMLPASVISADNSFASAGRRGSRSFGYAFPRLLISFGLVSAIMLGLALSISQLSTGDGRFFSHGGADVPAILAALVSNAIGAFQVAMTAVILSRAYMLAEENPAT